MAYKQKGCSPITAKIKRTTQGGMITQPILNMGSAVEMKGDSPVEMKGDSPVKQTGVLARKQKKGYTPVRTDNANPIPWDFRADSLTWFGGGSNSGIKGAMGSKKRKNEYDKKGWAYDETISMESLATDDKPIAKTMETPKQREVKKVAPKAVKIETKVSASKPKSKKEIRTAKSVERKSSKASKVRAKGEAALASGNLAKARRLKRREERIKKRAAKRASK